MSWSRRASALVLCVAALAACERAPAPVVTASAPRPAPTLAALGELEYPLTAFDGARVKLTAGRFEAAPETPPAEVLVASSELHPLSGVGDLDGDGSPDAAVVLASSGGGSGTFYELVAVMNTAEGLVPLPGVPLGDRIDLRRLEVGAGAISLEFLMAGPDDPLCCPRTKVQRAYRVQGRRLTPIAAAPASM
jgi:hypothetical protein